MTIADMRHVVADVDNRAHHSGGGCTLNKQLPRPAAVASPMGQNQTSLEKLSKTITPCYCKEAASLMICPRCCCIFAGVGCACLLAHEFLTVATRPASNVVLYDMPHSHDEDRTPPPRPAQITVATSTVASPFGAGYGSISWRVVPPSS
jgi:hypothetical protein